MVKYRNALTGLILASWSFLQNKYGTEILNLLIEHSKANITEMIKVIDSFMMNI